MRALQRECPTRFVTSIFLMIKTNLGPWNRLKVFLNSVSISPRSQKSQISTPWCAWHSGVKIKCLMHTAEIDSPVGCTPWRLSPQNDAHREVFLRYCEFLTSERFGTIDYAVICIVHLRDWLSSVMHTSEIDLAVWCTLQRLIPQWDVFWVGLKGTVSLDF